MWIVQWAERSNPEVVFSFVMADSLVALTIDDGPDPVITRRVLNVLKRYDARATFFLTGEQIEGREDILERIVNEGHELGNHGMRETPSIFLGARTFRKELHEADSLLSAYGPIRWFRPATGFYNRRIREEADSLGYTLALGSVYPNDAHVRNVRRISRYVLRHVEPGAVIILHEGRVGRRTIVESLERILPELRARGYRVVTLSELAAHTA